MNNQLVLDAIEHAIWTRSCEGITDLSGLIDHHDRGAQYTSLAYTERLSGAGIDASIGTTGDSYDCALDETINGLYKTELIKPRGPWRTADHVEIATLEWVDWFNHRRLYQHCGDIPPAELEAAYYRHHRTQQPAGFLKPISLRTRRCDSVVTGYTKPYDALVAYLDELDEYEVPVQRRAMAALGPRMLELARTRSAGALPYLVTPNHTSRARAALGPEALLVVEQKVVLDDDPQRGRALGRTRLGRTLQLANYAASLRREGFDDDDLAPPGSDRIIDALAIHGNSQAVAAGLQAHLDAGANQVAIQVISDGATDEGILRVARALAGLI